MRLFHPSPLWALALAAGFFAGAASAAAQETPAPVSNPALLQSVYKVRGDTHAAARVSQQKIDRLADQTQELLQQYRVENQQIDSLRVYNEQLEKLIKSQVTEKVKLQREIDSVTVIEREILPLMQRMVDMIAQVIEADVPFLLEERRERVSKLRDLMIRSDVTVAEKYRLIIEAYTIENSYGHTIEAYQAPLNFDGDGVRDVDFLRIGRVALFYQTPDRDVSGAWDVDAGAWVEVDNDYAGAIAQGFKVARKQAPPNLLLLPIQAAEDAQ